MNSVFFTEFSWDPKECLISGYKAFILIYILPYLWLQSLYPHLHCCPILGYTALISAYIVTSSSVTNCHTVALWREGCRRFHAWGAFVATQGFTSFSA